MGGREGGEGSSDHDSTERDHIIPCDDPQSKPALDLLVPVSGAFRVIETTQDLGAQPSTGSRRPSPEHDDLSISKRRKQAPGKSSFINTLTSADGTLIATAKKARKTRSDKGKTLGMSTVPYTAFGRTVS